MGRAVGLATSQRGMALLVSVVWVLLLTLIGVSSMQNATLQEKMAGGLMQWNRSFQGAEAALRVGESRLHSGYAQELCATVVQCAPPVEAKRLASAGQDGVSGVLWIAVGDAFYGIQNLGVTRVAQHLRDDTEATLYRITAVGLAGQSRTVLESVYALTIADTGSRRILWRQIE